MFQRCYNVKETFRRCPAEVSFIIKTAIWFDVLAALTTQQPPILLGLVRELFNPHPSSIEEITHSSPTPEVSMMVPMGCDNHIVWALAEAAALDVWKQQQQQGGRLSIPQLVSRGREIEEVLDRPSTRSDVLATNSPEYSRYLSSEIFRTSTRLYLRTVVSGDFPMVPDIQQGVEEVITTMQPLCGSTPPEMNRLVVRSTVFGCFITGCFATTPEHRRFIHDLVNAQCQDPVGNSQSILNLLKDVWAEDRLEGPVGWRERLIASKTLLV